MLIDINGPREDKVSLHQDLINADDHNWIHRPLESSIKLPGCLLFLQAFSAAFRLSNASFGKYESLL